MKKNYRKILFTPYERADIRFPKVGLPDFVLVEPSTTLEPLVAKEVLYPALFEKMLPLVLPPDQVKGPRAFVALGILQCANAMLKEWARENPPEGDDRLAKLEAGETAEFLEAFGKLLKGCSYMTVEVW